MLKIEKNIPLAPRTTFRIGGPAKFFAETGSEEELLEALKYANDEKLQFFILGGGSNILVSDEGFSGLAIKIKNSKFDIKDSFIEAGAGVFLAKAVKESINRGLSGLEWAAGIPGTIGGATRGNAGAYGGDMGGIVESARVLDSDKLRIRKYNLSECRFGYRDSIFKHKKNLIILSVMLGLRKGKREESEKKFKEIIAKRISKQPDEPSAGSFFVNPAVGNPTLIKKFEEERGVKSKNKKIPAGWLIDEADLSGRKIGGAMVSEIHSNFIVNTGGARAEDVIMLTSFIKQQVRDKFGVELREEVQYIGFN